jgi:hypothetical protein
MYLHSLALKYYCHSKKKYYVQVLTYLYIHYAFTHIRSQCPASVRDDTRFCDFDRETCACCWLRPIGELAKGANHPASARGSHCSVQPVPALLQPGERQFGQQGVRRWRAGQRHLPGLQRCSTFCGEIFKSIFFLFEE